MVYDVEPPSRAHPGTLDVRRGRDPDDPGLGDRQTKDHLSARQAPAIFRRLAARAQHREPARDVMNVDRQR